MVAKRYDCVPVHGPQGKKGPIKAYACANCMEFFAELSVAFLYNHDTNIVLRDMDEQKARQQQQDVMSVVIPEYNKWFPHNATQLKLHDPETYEILEKMWFQSS